MERRDLTEYLSQETMLRLTGEAFAESDQAQKVRRFPRWAALAACIALVVMAVNFDTVYAAVQGLLYFLPGSGPVAEPSFPDYWLPAGEYSAHTEEADYFVTYLYRWGDTLSLRVKKEISGYVMPLEREEMAQVASGEPSHLGQEAPEAVADMMTLAIRDEDGTPVELEDSHHSVFAVYGDDQAKLEMEWEFSDFTLERFTLLLDGAVELPVELQKIAVEDYAVAGGTTVRDAGYALTLLPFNENCSRFAILTAPDEEADGKTPPEGSYWSPLSFDIAAIGESGTVYEAQNVNSRPGCQEFYLPDLPEERIVNITVTGILESTRYGDNIAVITAAGVLESTRYWGKDHPALGLPALELGEEAALDTEVKLWNDTLTVEAAGLTQEGELWVRFRYQEDGRRLNQIDLEWPGSTRPSQRTTMDEVGGYTTAALEMADQAGKKTVLPVSFVSVVQEGRWEFEVA